MQRKPLGNERQDWALAQIALEMGMSMTLAQEVTSAIQKIVLSGPQLPDVWKVLAS